MPKYIYYIRKEKGKYQPYRCSKTKEDRILGAYPVIEDAENALHCYTRGLFEKRGREFLDGKIHIEGY